MSRPRRPSADPIAAVRTGDMIRVDVLAGELELEVDQSEIERRLAERPPPVATTGAGYGSIYLDQVEQADKGCDFACLRALPDEEPPELPLGLLEGWVLGD
jgi:dihydroxy-acid dehydratase